MHIMSDTTDYRIYREYNDDINDFGGFLQNFRTKTLNTIVLRVFVFLKNVMVEHYNQVANFYGREPRVRC